MKKLYYFFILIVCAIIIAVSLYNIYRSPIEVKSLEASYIIGSFTGFDVNGTALKFGQLTPGSSSLRKITITNDHPFQIRINFDNSPNLDGKINFDRNNIVLKINETKEFEIILSTNQNDSFGNYTGTFITRIYRY